MQVRNVKRIDKQTALTFSSEKSSIKERRLLCHQKEEEGKAGDIQPRLRQPLIELITTKGPSAPRDSSSSSGMLEVGADGKVCRQLDAYKGKAVNTK